MFFVKKLSDKELLQMGQTSNNKYLTNCLEKLKNNYKKLLLFSDKGQSSRAECLTNSLKDAASTQKELEKKKRKKLYSKIIYLKLRQEKCPHIF